jgi:hypothetical protein
MTSITERAAVTRPQILAALQKTVAGRWLPLAVVFAVAILVRHLVVANTDVSWLITLAEKVLDGQRLYVDLIEINPPASVFLYLPAVAFARALGLSPETAVDAAVFLAIGVSLWLAGRTLRQAPDDKIDLMRLAVLVAALLAILPAQTFGEREHIAVIFLLPLFALWSVRSADARPDDVLAVLAAGIGAGLALTIKPHFALGLAPAVIAIAVRRKSWQPLVGLENWIAGVIAASYGAGVLVFYPAFVSDIMPMVAATYLPVRQSLFVLLVHCPVLLLSALQLRLATSWRPGLLRLPAITVLLAAAGGFFLVFLLQGKGWPYHSYPTLAVVYIVVAAALSGRAHGPQRSRFDNVALMTGMAAVACATFYWMNLANSMVALNEPIRRLASHPRLLIISSDVSVGHPLVRQVGGTWVGRVGSLWITAGVITRQRRETLDAATAKELAAYGERDRAMLEEDIRRSRPDIILIDRMEFDWEAWARADPGLASQLAAYRTVDSSRQHVILRRHGE